MFIRQTRTASKLTGEAYFTFRLVRGERIGGRVRQITVLNLGRNFAIKQEHWPVLCSRIEQLLQPQTMDLRLRRWVLAALQSRASTFGRPVLLMHGDRHQFLVARPLASAAGGQGRLPGSRACGASAARGCTR